MAGGMTTLVVDARAPGRDAGVDARPPAGRGRGRAPARWRRRDWAEASALTLIVVAAAVLYGWDLSRQGWGNAYYAAAAQAGAENWKVMLFGGIDPGGAMATDKPPLALWAMSASVRVFGLSSWALFLPQILASLVTIVLLQRTVRRLAGALAGITAALVLAVTPVFGVLARFNDPDTMLVMLLTAAAYATVRATRSPGRGWLVVIGALLGAAFLTKWLVVALVVPGLAAAYVVAARERVAAATRHLVRSGLVVAGAAIATSGWWVALVALTPAAHRPHLDGSADNSVWGLLLGRNGFSRIGSAGGLISPVHHAADAISGVPGPLRLFGAPFDTQIGWLLPIAVAATLPALVRRARYPLRRAVPDHEVGYILWGGWLAVAAAVFSLMNGAMHPYYTVLLAPPVAALAGMGATELVGRGRRAAPAVVVAGATWVAWIVHARPGFGPRWALALLATGVVAAVVIAAPIAARPLARPRWAAGWTLAAITLLAGPSATLLATTTHAVTGANPLAGPGTAVAPHTSPALAAFLRSNRGTHTWAAAVVTATPAALLALDTASPVLALGGFRGSVPSPTLSQFQRWVHRGQVHYLVMKGPYRTLAPGRTPRSLSGSQAARIVTWVQSRGHRVAVPGDATLVYDLLPPTPDTPGRPT